MSEADGYRQVAGLLGYPDSVGLRRWLEYIMTEEQARLVAMLPAEAEELAPNLNLSVEKAKELIRDLYEKGVIVPKNFETLEGMNDRHLQTLRVVQRKALETLRTMPLSTAMEAVRALDMSIAKERLIRGEPTDRTASVEEVIKHEYENWLTQGDDDDKQD